MRSMICIRWLLSRNWTVGLFDLAAAFHVDVLGTVDHDIADRVVLEQQLERAEAEGLVEHFLDQPLALAAVEQRVFGVAQVFDHQANLAAEHVPFQFAHARQVELIHQLGVDPPLERLEVGALVLVAGSVGERRWFGGRHKTLSEKVVRSPLL